MRSQESQRGDPGCHSKWKDEEPVFTIVPLDPEWAVSWHVGLCFSSVDGSFKLASAA